MLISFWVTGKLISVFVFTTWIVQSLYFLNPKFQASSNLLWLYSPVCVRPSQKPRSLVFSPRGSVRDHPPHLPSMDELCLFDLLLYVYGKQLRSCRDGQLSHRYLTTLFLGKPPIGSLPVFSAHSFASN